MYSFILSSAYSFPTDNIFPPVLMDLLISLLTINYFSHEIKIVKKNVIRCDLSVTCHVLQCDITLSVTCISVTCYCVTCIRLV